MIEQLLSGLAYSTSALALSAIFAWLVLAALRPRSPRVHQVVWFVVLMQAFCWRPFGLAVLPPTEPPPIDQASSASHSIENVDDGPAWPAVPIQKTEAAPAPTPSVAPAALVPRQESWDWRPFAAGGWLLGVSLVLLLGIVDYHRVLRRLRGESAPVPAVWLVEWRSLPSDGAVLVATQGLGPLAIRTTFRAVVAVPTAFGESLTPAERRAVFAHELSHLRSGDPLWTLIAWLATALQWFNPFAWIAARRFHAAAELACDDRMDDEARLPLAHVLLNLGQPKPRTVLAMSGGTLAARIRALAGPRSQESRWKMIAVVAATFAAVSIGWIRLEAAPATEPPKEPSKETANPTPTSRSDDAPKGKRKSRSLDPKEREARLKAIATENAKRERERAVALWLRALRTINAEDDDALALEKVLAYLAARESRFGEPQMLDWEEHIETDAVLTLEALLKRNLKPRENETQRQALERALSAPTSDGRNRLAAMHKTLEGNEFKPPHWEERRDHWITMVAEVIESAARRTANEVWPRRIEAAPPNSPAFWLAVCCYQAALRGGGSATNADRAALLHALDDSTYLRRILVVETFAKGSVPGGEESWRNLTREIHIPQKSRFGGDFRRASYLSRRLHAMLEAAKRAPLYRGVGAEFRRSLNANYPADGLDALMEQEGKTVAHRVDFFLNRTIRADFEKRRFGDVLKELRSNAAVPMVILDLNWESNLLAVTMKTEAKWIDLLRDACRQAEYPLFASPDLIVVAEQRRIVDGKEESAVERLRAALERARTTPQPLRDKLFQPTFLKTSLTPFSQVALFLHTQLKLPVTLIGSEEIDERYTSTADAVHAPAAAVFELVAMSCDCAWTPLEGSVIFSPNSRRTEMEQKAAELRRTIKRLRDSSAQGDAAAAALLRPMGGAFAGTPLQQVVSSLKTKHAALQLDARAAEDATVNLDAAGVTVAEGLALLAWTNGLTLTFDGSKAVLTNK
jgi:beta-lactamase regulating signal transducer with metallopeptidase domain